MSRVRAKPHCVHENGALFCRVRGDVSDEARAVVQQMRQYLAGRMTYAETRDFVGLSIGQAAKLLGTSTERLAAIEAGAAPTPGEVSAMTKAYRARGFSDGSDRD